MSPNRALAVLRLAYTELQYWLIGLTPEGYHHAQALAWEALGNSKRAAKHLVAYLKTSDKPQIRALLAYQYARMGHWSDAAREYSAATATWPHPSIVLGLAEAQLHLGEVAKARELVASVEAAETPHEPYVESALASLRPLLEAASSNIAMEPGANTGSGS